jgi:N-acetylmuramoyl-L-alanine amidase
MVGTSGKSPNFDERKDSATPSLIILHYTGMQSADEALKRLCDPAAKVSSHYFISEDCEVIQLVEDSARAWHAGMSYWEGKTDINSESIGIEIVNPGHEFGYRPFPDAQVKAVISLCLKLMERYDIKPHHVLGHSDIAPSRKEDPGELFPWAELARHGAGVWPSPQDMDLEAAKEITDLHELLVAYGYNPADKYEDTVAAFHRHFYPEKFLNDDQPEKPDSETAARLLSLLRAKHAAS